MNGEITVPCVAAHLLAAGVLRFLPTDATVECERCGGAGTMRKAKAENCLSLRWVTMTCSTCDGTGRRPFRAGDSFDIRAGDDLSHPAICTLVSDGSHIYDGVDGIDYPLRPGEVVGRATVTNVLPIYHVAHVMSADVEWPNIQTNGPDVVTWTDGVRLRDHLEAGLVFTPGGVALDLTVETTG